MFHSSFSFLSLWLSLFRHDFSVAADWNFIYHFFQMSVPQNKKITPQPEAIWSVYTDDWICLVLMLVLLILLFFVRHCHLLCLNVFDSLMGHLGLTWDSETVISLSKFNDYYNMHVWVSWPNDKMFILINSFSNPILLSFRSQNRSQYI